MLFGMMVIVIIITFLVLKFSSKMFGNEFDECYNRQAYEGSAIFGSCEGDKREQCESCRYYIGKG